MRVVCFIPGQTFVVDDPKPSVIFGKRDRTSVIAEKQQASRVVLDPAPAKLWIYFMDLCRQASSGSGHVIPPGAVGLSV